MRKTTTRNIVAAITLDESIILSSGAPTFLAKDKEEQEKVASELGRALNADIYGLSNGVIVICQE